MDELCNPAPLNEAAEEQYPLDSEKHGATVSKWKGASKRKGAQKRLRYTLLFKKRVLEAYDGAKLT